MHIFSTFESREFHNGFNLTFREFYRSITICPRYAILVCKNWHFRQFIRRPVWVDTSNTRFKLFIACSIICEGTIKSSMYIRTFFFDNPSLNMAFINFWKMAGELLKADLRSVVMGSGLFIYQQSFYLFYENLQIHVSSFLFLTKKIGLAYSELNDLIMWSSNHIFNYFSTSSFSDGDNLRAFWYTKTSSFRIKVILMLRIFSDLLFLAIFFISCRAFSSRMCEKSNGSDCFHDIDSSGFTYFDFDFPFLLIVSYWANFFFNLRIVFASCSIVLLNGSSWIP